MRMTQEIQAIRIQDGNKLLRTETVVREETLCLHLNGKLLVRLLCSPSHIEDLAVGFLFSEGLICGLDEIKTVEEGSSPMTLFVRTTGRTPDEILLAGAVRTSGCGGGVSLQDQRARVQPVVTDLRVEADEILSLARQFEASSVLFRQTGGVHACALGREKKLAILREDIGRHNALDKILGVALKEDIDLPTSIAYISGRISSEMVLKSARARVGFVVSRTAPTAAAVELAADLGVCVVGFVRGGRMNVYSSPDRIV